MKEIIIKSYKTLFPDENEQINTDTKTELAQQPAPEGTDHAVSVSDKRISRTDAIVNELLPYSRIAKPDATDTDGEAITGINALW